MIKLKVKSKTWWQNLKRKKRNFQFFPTKFISNKLEINAKILSLLNEKLESVNQLPTYGLIVLNQTILNSHDKTSVSEQGIISSDFFKARVIDVDNTIISGVYFHLVKVISGIITINFDQELTLSADEQFCEQLSNNKLVAKLLLLFLEHLLEVSPILIKKIKVTINEELFSLQSNNLLKIEQTTIFTARNLINEFLTSKRIDFKKYWFLKDVLTKQEKESIAKIELIEIKDLKETKNNFSVEFLVSKEKVDQFLFNSKKDLFSAIKLINMKIKLLDNPEISEFYPDLIVDSYEKLAELNQGYSKLKDSFINFKNQNPEVIKKFINESIETQYSEKIGSYEFLHISYNNLLIDKAELVAKAAAKIKDVSDRVLFLSNNNFGNSMVILKISENLIDQISLMPLVNQFSNSSFKEISYNNQDSVFIEADNYQVINDLVSNIINFFKISSNQTI